MSRIVQFRRGATNKGLLIGLAIAVVAAGIFFATRESDSAPAPFVPTEPTPLRCRACSKTTVVQPAELSKLKYDTKTSSYECPACHELRAKISSMPDAGAESAEGGRVAPAKP